MAKKNTAPSSILDVAVLQGKRKQAELAFENLAAELNKAINTHNEYVESTKTELSRLQGEYRLLTTLLGTDKK